jgi:hypothetical protein
MDINLIATKQDLLDLWNKISQLLKENITNTQTSGKTSGKKNYLRSRDVRKMLNICDNKLRGMRESREIPFTLIGKTYYYPEQAIHELMESNMRKPNP